MKKRVILLVGLCLILLAASLPVFSGCDGEDEMYTVCISQIAIHPDLDSNRQGIIDAMAEMGYVEGENVEFVFRSADGDMTTQASIVRERSDISQRPTAGIM